MITTRLLTAAEISAHAPALGEILADCTEGGASVGFLRGLSAERATLFWRDVATRAPDDGRAVIVAEASDGAGELKSIVGVVQVVPAGPENQPHRADVSKMLVHSRARRQGVGAALLEAAHAAARALGKTLLVLDTEEHSDAERLYARAGWTRAGVLPDYAIGGEGVLISTVLYWKRLG